MHEIKGFSKYHMTDNYEIFSTKLNNKLTIRCNRGGYPAVAMTTDTGRRTTKSLHVIVAEIFVENPSPEEYKQVNHKDGNKMNYHPSNLEWVSCSQNVQHAYDTGLHVKAAGINSPNTNMTEHEVRTICELLEEGLSPKDVSETVGVAYHTVRNIKRKAIFADIVKDYTFNLTRPATLSVETVKWICEMLEKGFKCGAIVKMHCSEHLNYQRVYGIKSRKTFTEVSKDYNF
uniref:HNH endonuclease n=1 Tax=Klebsiella phage FKP3 TaxID=3231233 RepID=A0AAU8HZG1_9CAUD